jgi:hypothetical protein
MFGNRVTIHDVKSGRISHFFQVSGLPPDTRDKIKPGYPDADIRQARSAMHPNLEESLGIQLIKSAIKVELSMQ